MTTKKYIRKTLLLAKYQDRLLRSLVARRKFKSESEAVRYFFDVATDHLDPRSR